jgi:hypothetical protein
MRVVTVMGRCDPKSGGVVPAVVVRVVARLVPVVVVHPDPLT